MKEIAIFMENTSKPYLKKYLLIYIGMIFLQTILYYLDFTRNSAGFLSLTTCLFIVMIFLLHRKRYKTFLSYGGLTRIRLLPIPKHTFLISELLFIFATYAGLLAAQNISWLLFCLIKGSSFPILNNPYMFLMLSNTFTSHAAFTYLDVLMYLMVLITLSFMTCIFLISQETAFASSKTIGIYILLYNVLLILRSAVQSIDNTTYFILVLLLILPVHLWLLRTYFYQKGGFHR